MAEVSEYDKYNTLASQVSGPVKPKKEVTNNKYETLRQSGVESSVIGRNESSKPTSLLGSKDDGPNAVVAGQNINEERAYRQSGVENIFSGLAKGTGILGTSLANTFIGLPYGIAKASYDGLNDETKTKSEVFSDIYDNEFTRLMDKANKGVEELFPNYYSEKEQKASALSWDNIGSSNFWGDKVLKNAGFTAGAILGGGVISKGIRGSSWLAKAFVGANELTEGGLATTMKTLIDGGMDAASAARKVSSGVRALNATAVLTTSAWVSAGEASGEAIQTKQELKKSLDDRYKLEHGVNTVPDEESVYHNRLASNAGNAVFGANMALLMGTESFQFGKLWAKGFTPELQRAEKLALNNVGEAIVKQPSFTKRILAGLGKIGANGLAESFEEGSQTALQAGSKDYFGRQYDKKALTDTNALVSSTLTGLQETFGSKDGIESMLLGAITGVGSHVATSTLSKVLGKVRGVESDDSRTEALASIINSKQVRLAPFVKSITRGHSINQDKETNLLGSNPSRVVHENLTNDEFKNIIQPFIEADRFDLLEDKLNNEFQKDDEEFKRDNPDTQLNRKTSKEYVAKLIQDAKKLKANWENINEMFPKSSSQLKEMMWSTMSDIQNKDTRMKSLALEVASNSGILFNDNSEEYLKQVEEAYDKDPSSIDINKARDVVELDAQKKAQIEGYKKLLDPTYQAQVQKIVAQKEEEKKNHTPDPVVENNVKETIPEPILNTSEEDIVSPTPNEVQEPIIEAPQATQIVEEGNPMSEPEITQPEASNEVSQPTIDRVRVDAIKGQIKGIVDGLRSKGDDNQSITSQLTEQIGNTDDEDFKQAFRESIQELSNKDESPSVENLTTTQLDEVNEKVEDIIAEEDSNKGIIPTITEDDEVHTTYNEMDRMSSTAFRTTANHQEAIDSGLNSVLRYQNFINNPNTSLAGLRLMVITPQSFLYAKVQNKKQKTFEENRKKEGKEINGIYAVVVDENNNLVVTDTSGEILKGKETNPNSNQSLYENIVNNKIFPTDGNKEGYYESLEPLTNKALTPDIIKQFPILGNRKYLSVSDRLAVIVEVSPGVLMPFYQSSGESGDKKVGQWYPFFGFDNGYILKYQPNGIDMSKYPGYHVNNYYKSRALEKVGKYLDSLNIDKSKVDSKEVLPYEPKTGKGQQITEFINKEVHGISDAFDVDNELEGILVTTLVSNAEQKESGFNAVSYQNFARSNGFENAGEKEAKDLNHPVGMLWNEHKNDLAKTRQSILDGSIKYLKIDDISQGIFQDTKAKNSVGETLGVDINDPRLSFIIPKIEDIGSKDKTTTIGKAEGLNKEQTVKVGKPYLIYNGKLYPLNARKLNTKEVGEANTLLNEAYKKFKNSEKIGDILKKVKELVYINDDTMKTILKGQLAGEDLIDYLFNKYRQVNANQLANNPTYRTSVLEGNDPAITINYNSHPTTVKDKPNYLNGYLVYSPIEEKVSEVVQAKKETKQITVEDISNTTKEDAIETSKPLTKEQKLEENRRKRAALNTNKDNSKLSLDRKANLQKFTKNENITEAKKWFEDRFNGESFEVTQSLINGNAFGEYTQAATKLYEGAEEGTVYHEAFHKVTQEYLTPKQVKSLYDAVRKGINNKFSDLEAEEWLAEEFRKFVLSGQKAIKNMPYTNNIFRKLYNWIKSLVTGKTTPQQVFDRLASKKGYTGAKKFNNAQFTKLEKAIERTTHAQTKNILESVNGHFFNRLNKADYTPAELLGEKGSKLIEGMYGRITDDLYSNYLDEEDNHTEGLHTDEQWFAIKQHYKLMLNLDDNDEPHGLSELVKEAHIKYLRDLGIDIKVSNKKSQQEKEKEEEETEVDEADKVEGENAEAEDRSRDSAYDKNSNEESSINSAPNSIKLLVMSLPAVDRDGQPVFNNIGGPALNDYLQTMKLLYSNLNGLSQFHEMYAKLQELSSRFPVFTELLNRLGEPGSNKELNQFLLENDFRQAFSKFESKGTITLINPENGEIYQVDANANKLRDRIKENWTSNLRVLANNKDSYIKKQDDGFLALDKSFITDARAGKFKGNSKALLGALGVEFTDLTQEQVQALPGIKDITNTIFKYVAKVVEDGKTINDLFSKDADIKGQMNLLLDIEVPLSKETVELSYISAEGKRIYAVSLNNYYSLVVNALNSAKTKDELFEKYPHLNNPYTQNSVWIKNLFDKAGNKVPGQRIYMNTVSGLKIQNDNDSGIGATKMEPSDKIVQEFNDLLTTGSTSLIRAADKSSEYAFGITSYGNNEKLAIPLEDISKEGFNTSKVHEIFFGYFMDELNRIRAFNKGVGKNIAIYNKQAGDFSLFGDILTSETLSELEAYKTNEEEIDALLEAKINKELVGYLDKYTKENKKYMQDRKVGLKSDKGFTGINTSLATTEEELDNAIKTFTANHLVNMIEQSKLLIGDSAFYKDKIKRISSGTGTKKFAASSKLVDNWFNNFYKNEVGRVDEKIADGKLNVVIFDDVKAQLDTFEDYVQALVAKGVSEDKANDILAAYKGMDEGDAQGWITLDEYREFMMRVGGAYWTEQHEAQYRYERALEAREKGQELTSWMEKALEKNPEFYFMPIKAQHMGPQNIEGLYAPAFHKYSLSPLYHSLVRGRNMEKMLNTMRENKVGYALFGSGSKVGTPLNSEGKLPSFYNKDGSIAGISSGSKYKTSLDFKLSEEVLNNWIQEGQEIGPDRICDATSLECITQLKNAGYKVALHELEFKAKSPLGNFDITHKAALILVGDKYYLYDMPQTEFLDKLNANDDSRGNVKVTANFNPRFIELTEENLSNYYGSPEGTYKNIVKQLTNSSGSRVWSQNTGRSMKGQSVMPLINKMDKGEYSANMTDWFNENYPEDNASATPIQSINYENLGIQLDIAPKVKESLIFGSQTRKLLFSNIFGENVKPEFAKLGEEYNKLIDNLVIYEFDKLTKKLGLKVSKNDDGSYKSFTFNGDYRKLVNQLKDQLEDKDTADNILDSLQVNEDGSLKYPIDSLVNRSKIESMLFTIVNSKVIKQKMNGNSLVQLASSGFEKVGKREVGQSNYLAFYTNKGKDGKTTAMEVEIPMNKNFAALLKKYKTIDGVNQAISEGKIDTKQLTLIGYRIPTQGLNSMDVMTIKRFMPSESGIAIILPTGVVAKSGGDYDIDKLNIFMPNLFYDEKNDYVGDYKLSKNTQSQDYKKSAQNKIIDIMSEVLTHPDNFIDLTTPNTTDDLVNLTAKIREAQGKKGADKASMTKQFRFDYLMEQFTYFLGGKAALGIAATHNTHHVVSQIAGVKLNASLPFKHNRKGEQIDLGQIYTQGGQKITDIINQFINAYVDVAKDPFYKDLNAGTEVSSVWMYMLRAGVDLETIGYFMTQPIILEYVNTRKLNKSLVTTSNNKAQGERFVDLSLEGRSKITYKIEQSENPEFKKKWQQVLDNGSIYNDLLSKYGNTNGKYVSQLFNGEDANNKLVNLIKDKSRSKEFRDAQTYLLEKFLEIEKQAGELTKLMQATNNDTTKIQNYGSVFKREQAESEVNNTERKDNIIPAGTIENIWKKTIVGSFNKTKEFKGMYKELTLYTKYPYIKQAIDNLVSEIPAKSDWDKEYTKIQNDFIGYLLQRYGKTIDGQSISSKVTLLSGDNSLAKQLINLRKEGLINNNPFFDELIGIIAPKTDEIDNVKLYSRRMSAFESNVMTEAFRDMLESNNPRVVEFAQNLAYITILQSGLQNSPITFTELIPFDFYNQLASNAIKNVGENNQEEVANDFITAYYNNKNSGYGYKLQDYGIKEGDKPKVSQEVEVLPQQNDSVLDIKEDKEPLLLSPQDDEITTVDNISDNKDEFQYYGARYKMALDSEGFATSVEGYKGTQAKMYKIVDAYNDNKDVDPQGFRQFRNFESNLANKPKVDKYELFPGVFANEGQKLAIDKIEEFLNSKDDLFLLKGRGGTGKTTIIKKALESLPANKKVVGATVADQAREVLGEAFPGLETYTTASLLGLVADYNDKTGELYFREKNDQEIMDAIAKGQNTDKMGSVANGVLIVDETSMIGEDLYDLIVRKAREYNAKVIFMGDNAQIPPINNNGTSKDSPAFDLLNTFNHAELTQRMRQSGESPILPITDLYANNIEKIQAGEKHVSNPLGKSNRVTKFDTLKNEGVQFISSLNETLDNFIQDYKNGEGKFNSVIIGAKNKTLDVLNRKVREKLFNTSEPYVVGDKIRFNSPMSKEGKPLFANGQVANITKVGKGRVYNGLQTYDLTIEYEGVDKKGNKEIKTSKITSISTNDKEAWKKVVNSLALEIKQSGDRNRWREEFYPLKESVADLGYNYAITAHKVQGSTYNSVYVIENDILDFPGGDEQVNRMLYTAVSRPRTKLVIYNSKEEATVDNNYGKSPASIIGFNQNAIREANKISGMSEEDGDVNKNCKI